MLLATKLHIPVRRHDLVARPRLLEKLHAGLRSRLILLSSPPGFGKTTLLTQWIAACFVPPEEVPAVAWLALDDGDNDPARFFAYLAAAVQTLCATGAVAEPPPIPVTPNHEQLMTDLINAVAARPGRKLLVLDDYHVIRTPALHQAIALLVEYMPTTLHLVVSTRADPPLPLAHWRARRDLTELREADLRFREDEAHEFLTAVMGVALTPQDVAVLEQRTEGWIAGLQLAALSLRDAADAPRQVKRLTGTHAYIGDYLAEEVLQRQPPETQQFLLDTSIVRRLCGDLCNALTGRTDGAARLAALDRAHLFLVPLDDERVWYRYHHLFAEMLVSRVPATHLRELHRRAAVWYAEHGSIGEAVEHALAADPSLAADLLEEHRRQFSQRGEYVTLAGWLQQLPDALLGSRPQLCLLRAKTHMFLHQLPEAEAWLSRTHQALAATPGLDPDAAILSAAIIVQCDLALNRNELAHTVQLAQAALALIPSARMRQQGETLMLLGVAYYWRSEFARAEATWGEASRAATAGGDTLMTVFARGNAARALYHQGRLHASAAELNALLQEAAARGDAQLPIYAGSYVALAQVEGEWNQLELAHHHLLTGMGLARQAGNPRTLLQGYVHAPRILWGQGRPAAAAAMAAEAQTLIRQVRLPPRMVEEFTCAAIRLALAAGDTDAVQAWQATAPDPAQPPAPGEEQLQLLLARVRAAQGAYAEALDLLARVQATVDARQMRRLGLETQLCRATVLAAMGAERDAVPLLRTVLALAAPEGYVRLFVDEGDAMRRLLVHLLPDLTDDGLCTYATRLLQAFPPLPTPAPDQPTPAPTPAPAPSALSERELEVLRLVAQGLSDRAVAEHLVVVTGTVKRHLSNIYGKLGVRSRTQALARARALGWLHPNE